MQRQFFDISTDTGTYSDSGPAFFGEIAQVRWDVTTADTGGDLGIWLQQRPGDTGNGVIVLNDADCLGSDFTKQPTIPQTHPDGFDTGAALDVPIVSAGEHLRIKITPAGAAVAGRLYVWVKN